MPGNFSHWRSVFPKHPHGRGFGASPYFFGGYGFLGSPYPGMPYYGAGYACDLGLSDLPYSCQPEYVYGSQPYETETTRGYEAEDAPPVAELTSSSGTDARRVIVTYDGGVRSPESAGQPLVITSGNHQLIVAAKSH